MSDRGEFTENDRIMANIRSQKSIKPNSTEAWRTAQLLQTITGVQWVLPIDTKDKDAGLPVAIGDYGPNSEVQNKIRNIVQAVGVKPHHTEHSTELKLVAERVNLKLLEQAASRLGHTSQQGAAQRFGIIACVPKGRLAGEATHEGDFNSRHEVLGMKWKPCIGEIGYDGTITLEEGPDRGVDDPNQARLYLERSGIARDAIIQIDGDFHSWSMTVAPNADLKEMAGQAARLMDKANKSGKARTFP